MAQPKLQAEFFVCPSGTVFLRARALRRSERFRFYKRSDRRCAQCRRPVKFGGINASPFETIAAGHVDHIVPRARGGQNDEQNLRLLCLTCNCSKGAR
jgi:ATP adenylyltransferase